jgi:thioredoxin 1
MALVHINSSNFKQEVEDSDIPVIIDFWAEWCTPCLMMAPVFEELSKEYEGKLKFAKLDTEAEPGIPAQFMIQGIPTLVVVHKGKEVNRIVGFAPKEVLKQKIEQILSQTN